MVGLGFLAHAGLYLHCVNKTVKVTLTSVRLYTKYEAGARKWLAKHKGWKQGEKLAWLGPNTIQLATPLKLTNQHLNGLLR